MKTTLNLTFEDGLKVVEAMKNVAVENGWDAEELDECGVLEEYSRVVDAALTAMGINVCIDPNPSCEDEDEDEDEEDFDFDDEEEEEEDEDEDEDEDDNDNVAYSLTAKGEFVLRYMEAGHTFEEACEVADLLFGSNEDEEDEEEDEDENEEEDDDDEELPSDKEVMNLIMQVLYGQ